MSSSRIRPSAVYKAAKRLSGVVNKTPVMTSRTLDKRVDRQVFLKCENFQRAGAFKFRGAYNALSQLTSSQKEAGVITHSSGNHAQAVALAARLLRVEATVVMPDDAPSIKREATIGYGARIISCPAIDRELVCEKQVEEHGYTLIHPYDDYRIIAGAGTVAWELFQEVGHLDTLFVPVGGGGLISGCALAAADKSPGCRVVGVEPAAADDAGRSWRENRVVTLEEVPVTMADGLRTRYVGTRNLPIMRKYVDAMITVDEEGIRATLEFLWTRLKIIVEPSAAVALAPVFMGLYPDAGQRVGVILSGGNVELWRYAGERARKDMAQAQSFGPPIETPPARDTRRRPMVLVADSMMKTGLEILRTAADVDERPGLSEEELFSEIGKYQALVVGPNRQMTEQVIEYGFELRAIGNLSSRLDNIDVSTARNMGIKVCNAPSGRVVAIAEHTLARLLRLAGEFAQGQLAGTTLGIIGFGRIGREVAKRAQAFDMRVIVNQPRLTPQLALSAGVGATDLNELLQRADFITLHVPLKAETETILGKEEFAQMKKTSCLINTGHTDLIDEDALLWALEEGQITAAALSAIPPKVPPRDIAFRLRKHPRVIVSPHVLTIIRDQDKETAVSVAKQIVDALSAEQASESLSLEIVPIAQVSTHERIDERRVARLMSRFRQDGRLVNPPVTIRWRDKFVILDGATRFMAFKRLDFPHIIVQIVTMGQRGVELHTWYHVISSDKKFDELREHLQGVQSLVLRPLPVHEIQTALRQTDVLCCLMGRDGTAMSVQVEVGADRLTVLNAFVDSYTEWGDIERTLLTDLPRLLAHFPRMAAVAVFPQLRPETVFEAATQGDLLPAGLTRFVIPGRILRLNADLNRLKEDEPLVAKRAWLNRFLEDKLARSRLRFYEESVILLDE